MATKPRQVGQDIDTPPPLCRGDQQRLEVELRQMKEHMKQVEQITKIEKAKGYRR